MYNADRSKSLVKHRIHSQTSLRLISIVHKNAHWETFTRTSNTIHKWQNPKKLFSLLSARVRFAPILFFYLSLFIWLTCLLVLLFLGYIDARMSDGGGGHIWNGCAPPPYHSRTGVYIWWTVSISNTRTKPKIGWMDKCQFSRARRSFIDLN